MRTLFPWSVSVKEVVRELFYHLEVKRCFVYYSFTYMVHAISCKRLTQNYHWSVFLKELVLLTRVKIVQGNSIKNLVFAMWMPFWQRLKDHQVIFTFSSTVMWNIQFFDHKISLWVTFCVYTVFSLYNYTFTGTFSDELPLSSEQPEFYGIILPQLKKNITWD